MELIGVIGVFFLALLGIFGAAVSRQLTDEFKAWTPWLVRRFIQHAVRQLPESQRERFTEEWQSHVDEIPGEVGKLIVAFGFLQASPKMSRGLTLAKRILDVAISSIPLFIVLPLFTLIAVAVWLDSEGPVISFEVRQDHGYKTVRLLRFRTTMAPEDGPDLAQVRHGDQHLTRTGKVLRRLHLDELPLLINVLRGELSLVPRKP